VLKSQFAKPADMRTPRVFCALGCALAASAQTTAAPLNQYALKGVLVTPSEVIADGIIIVGDGQIQAIGKDIPIPTGIKVIETRAFICPGFIDLHDHITWNFLPHWKTGQKFANRYEWQQLPEYFVALKTPHDQIVTNPSPSPTRPPDKEQLACDANRYGEVKAIVGGATSVVDSLGNSAAEDPCIKGLARNLNSYSGLYPTGEPEKLRNVVFPLEQLSNDELSKVETELKDGAHALVAHLAEGKPTDASSAREFRMFRARGLVRDGVSIVHGTALHGVEFKEMADNHVGLIWSPRSNIELYGDTTDVRTAHQYGVNIALAPDWSPSGSDGVLEELNYAAMWNAGQVPRVFTDAELVAMVTSSAAKLAKLDGKIGSLQVNHVADLLLLTSDESNAYRALVRVRPSDIKLVIIGGIPVYGDEDAMKSLAPDAKVQSLNICGQTRVVRIENESNGASWKSTVDELTKALRASGLTLSELAPCP
jgi:5-methylthioadenosine/S-adenosylhomocysteine deaminase